MTSDPLLLIDTPNLVYRSHFACQSLATSTGQPSGMVYGFLRAVQKLKVKFSTRILFCWDNGQPTKYAPGKSSATWRKLLFADYKATRKHDPEIAKAIDSQIFDLFDVLKIVGYKHVRVPGLEADDLIGLLSASHKGQTHIYSADMDLYQLLNNTTHQIVHRKSKDILITAEAVEKEYKVKISRWPEYLALGGDSSDNITLKGMGPKTAQKLLDAGVDLRKTLVDQPEIPVVTGNWSRLQLGFKLAHIPRTPNDKRIKHLLPSTDLKWINNYAPRLRCKETEAISGFEQFCEKYQLISHLADSHLFVNHNGNLFN